MRTWWSPSVWSSFIVFVYFILLKYLYYLCVKVAYIDDILGKIVFECERGQLGFLLPHCFVQICNIYTSMKQNQGWPPTSLDFKGEIWLFLPKYNMTP
jgi:hypothetical protein